MRKYNYLMPQSDEKKLEIKKYPNRRYYDATHSRHFTLEEIREMIQQGYDIRVLDAKSGKDITAQVLIQIILELDTPKLDSLPVPLLVRLIRMNDLLIKDFIEKYFNQALKSFFEYQHQFEEQVRRAHGLPSAFPSVAAWTKAIFQPFAEPFSPWASHEDSQSGNPEFKGERDLHETVEELQRQVAKLKQERSKTKRKKQTRKSHIPPPKPGQ
jgi:polyhydroxyalkanoate synthesis repressor PhaR